MRIWFKYDIEQILMSSYRLLPTYSYFRILGKDLDRNLFHISTRLVQSVSERPDSHSQTGRLFKTPTRNIEESI